MPYQSRLEIVIDSRSAERNLKQVQKELGDTERKGVKAFGGLSSAGAAFGSVIAGLGVGLLARQVVQASDSYANLRSQLRLVTDSQEELNSVYDETLRIANDTRQSLDSTINLYARMARATERLGLSNEQLLTISEAINQSFIISGATAQEASSAVLQLAQGMASGTLRGEELNAVMESSPRLARAIADSMGVTIGQLRELGAAGEINAAKVSRALLEAAEDIDRDFQNVTRTVGQAMQQLRNDVLNALGPTDASGLVDSVDELRQIVNDPQFQDSIVTLTSALFTFVGAVAKATSETVQFTKWIGEELAAAVAGPAFDDIPRLEDKIRSLKDEIADAQELGTVLGGRGLELNQKRIEELSKSLAIYETALANAREQASKGVTIRVTEGRAGIAPTDVLGGDTGGSAEKSNSLPVRHDSLLGRVSAGERADEIVAAQFAEAEAVRRGLDQKYAIEQAHQERMQALRDGERLELIENQAELNELIVSSTQQRNEELARLERSRFDVLTDAQEGALGALGNAMGNFADIAKEGGKEAFSQYKALATGQAIIATALAATKALAATPFPPVNIALAASIGALGAVQVAKIQGQEYVGQAHDGHSNIPTSGTWNLEKGERVIGKDLNRDLTQSLAREKQGGGNPVSVTNVFQISTGVSQTVQSEFVSMMPMIEQRMLRSVITAISQGGPMARAVGRK